jgi:LemA protein
MSFKKIPKKWIGIGIVIIVILIIVSIIWGSYNNLVQLDQTTQQKWADVEAQYQRRVDLIPNIVNVVESYAEFERDTLTQITQLRSQWQSQPSQEQRVETANQIETALSKLLLIAENYPELKTSTNFLSLQDSLAETENMISVARMRFNDAVRNYNTAVRVFPSNIIAGWFGFVEHKFFEAITPGAENAPVVDINI